MNIPFAISGNCLGWCSRFGVCNGLTQDTTNGNGEWSSDISWRTGYEGEDMSKEICPQF